MGTLRLAQPDPLPETLLVHARKIARVALRTSDATTGDFLIMKAEEQYVLAIDALESTFRIGEASEARTELKEFSVKSRIVVHDAPVLADGSAFRKALDALAASKTIGPYYNGTDDLDEIVSLAKRQIMKRNNLSAAEDATKRATCLLWRAQREDEAVYLYNEFTDALVRDVRAQLDNGDLYLVAAKADVATKRLVLTARRDEANQLKKLVDPASQARPATHVP